MKKILQRWDFTFYEIEDRMSEEGKYTLQIHEGETNSGHKECRGEASIPNGLMSNIMKSLMNWKWSWMSRPSKNVFRGVQIVNEELHATLTA